MRVRISFDALRLCLLVAAGVTSGYLWRAAFESSSPEDVRVAAKPRIIEPAPAPPVVRIPPRHLVRPSRPTAAHLVVRRTVAEPARRASTGLTSTPVTSTPTPTPTPSPKPTQTPTPSPTPSPTPTPTPTLPPASQAPRTAPSIQTTTPAVSSPTPAAAPQPPAAPPPTTSTTSEDESRPGWGKGDENHDHSGPGKKNP